jgi:integrase
VKYYNRFLREIEALKPDLPFASFTRRAVVDFIETYSKAHQRRQSAAVLKNLFKLARYYGVVAADETAGLRLKTSKPRDRIWTDDEIARWLEAASAVDPPMVTIFLLLEFTAQRPADVLRMAWPQYSGSAIRLRQQKTGALLDIPVHPVLRDHLDGLSRSVSTLTIVAFRGRPVKYLRFNERFRRVAQRTGIDAQARDMRRTAMLRTAEAGATVRRSRASLGTPSRRRSASSRPTCRATAISPRSPLPAWLSTKSGRRSNASPTFSPQVIDKYGPK